jgi:hypothetical protein
MHRREVLLQLSASGFIAAWPPRLPDAPLHGVAPTHVDTPFAFLTDQPYRASHASWVLQIPPNTFLSPAWHVGVRVRSIRAAFGPANALLLMGTLRDLKAAVHVVHRAGKVELIGATLPAERWTLHVRS